MITFNTLIEMFGKLKEYDEMQYYYEEMEIQGVKHNWLTQVSLLRSFTFNGDIELSERQFAEMEKFYYQNSECYNLMFDMYFRMGNIEKCLEWEKKMENDGFLPLREMCDRILEYYAQKGDAEQVWNRYHKMRTIALKPQQKTKSILVKYGMQRFIVQDKVFAGRINKAANPGSYFTPWTMPKPHRPQHHVRMRRKVKERDEVNLFM